jgi:hypothetical protein
VDTSHNFAVAICGGVTAENPVCQVLCSGALIAPNLVISARHCVDNVSSDTIDCSVSTFGPPLYPATQYYITTDPNVSDMAATWYEVTQIVTPTPTEFCGNDLSLLVLNTNVPAKEVPVLVTPEIWFPIDSPQYSSTETAIGYGVDAPSDAAADTAGVRRILEKISLECIPGDPALDCDPVSQSGVATNEFEAGNGPCEGDSGSSAYEQTNFDEGNWLSLGVLSRGGVQGDTCEGSVYTQLYPWQSLILSTAQQAAALGGYPAPAWTTNPGDASPFEAGSPPLPDSGATADSGGAPIPDSGSDTTAVASSFGADAGGRDSGSLAPLGATCAVDSNCSTDVCVSSTGDDGFVCSVACTATAECPREYSCVQGFCFASGRGVSSDAAGSSGGCSVGRVKATGGGPDSLPWAGLAAVFACNRRRARRRGSFAHR